MKTIFNLKLYMIVLLVLGVLSCEKRSNYVESGDTPGSLNTIESVRISGVEATIDQLSREIFVSLPGTTDISAVLFQAEVPDGVTLSPASGSSVDLSDPLTITMDDGIATKTYRLTAKLLPSKIAFLGDGATPAEISDDDVRAAALWAMGIYGSNFKYIPYTQLIEGSLDDVNVLLYVHDLVGSTDQPAAVLERLNVISKFFVLGGKIVGGLHGTGLVEELGRDTSGLRNIFGTGAGGINPDTWGIGLTDTSLGNILSAGCDFNTDGNIPVINPGYKEDHNALWNLGSLDSPAFSTFGTQYNAECVGAWDWALGGQQYAGIVLFKPTPEFQGYFLAIGIGGMEWNMNDDRENPYLSNVQTIYRNGIDYLATR